MIFYPYESNFTNFSVLAFMKSLISLHSIKAFKTAFELYIRHKLLLLQCDFILEN